MNLDHPNSQPQQMFHVSQNIAGLPRMQTAAGNQPLRIFLAVVGDKLIDPSSKTNHLGRHIVYEYGAIDPGDVKIFKKSPWRPAKLLYLGKISTLPPNQRERLRFEHLHRLNMDMAVSNQANPTRH